MAKKKSTADQAELKKLGKRLRQLRVEAGFASAEKFANEHDLSRVHYGRWESGLHNIGYTHLLRLAKAYGVSVSEMLDGLD